MRNLRLSLIQERKRHDERLTRRPAEKGSSAVNAELWKWKYRRKDDEEISWYDISFKPGYSAISTDVRNREDGRIQAFNNGVREVCNLMGVGELPGLVTLTQMTYEEDHEDGTYTVYRLLKINEDALEEAAEKRQKDEKVEPYVEV